MRSGTAYHRILAVAPSSKGFGFAILEGENALVDWGVKSVEGDKNEGTLTKVGELISHYQPHVLVLEDYGAKGSRRAPRIQVLGEELTALAGNHDIKVVMLSKDQVKRTFFEDGDGTKHTIALIISKRFPEELGFRLPPKRRFFDSVDSRMDIFDAVALALVFRLRRRRNVTAPVEIMDSKDQSPNA